MNGSGDKSPDIAPDGSLADPGTSRYESGSENTDSNSRQGIFLTVKVFFLRVWNDLKLLVQLSAVLLVGYSGASFFLSGREFIYRYQPIETVQPYLISDPLLSIGVGVFGFLLAYVTIIRGW